MVSDSPVQTASRESSRRRAAHDHPSLSILSYSSRPADLMRNSNRSSACYDPSLENSTWLSSKKISFLPLHESNTRQILTLVTTGYSPPLMTDRYSFDLVLLGFGAVAQAFVKLLMQRSPALGFQWRVVGVATRRHHCAVSTEGIDCKTLVNLGTTGELLLSLIHI